MANVFSEYAQKFQPILDEELVQGLRTGWMELNGERIDYNGGKDIRIAKYTVDDLGDYSRKDGYATGGVKFEWETKQLKYDRSTLIDLDTMDINEENFIPTATGVLNQLLRTKVAPEVDLVRIAELSQVAGTKKSVKITKANALEEFLEGVMKVVDSGYDGQLIAHISTDMYLQLQLRMADQLGSVTFSVGGVDATFPSINDVALIVTTSDKMFDKVKKTGQKIEADGNKVNFLIAGREVPIAIVKHNPMNVITPEENQSKDGFLLKYRLYHGIFTEDNKVNAVYVCTNPGE